MEKKLTNNLGLKLISVFLAFFIWLAVMNVANPDEYDTKEVALEVLGGDVLEASGKTYELLTDKKTVTISYKYKALDGGSISASDFRAYIDLADMYEPTGAVQVNVESKNSKVISATARPSVVRVKTEDLQRKLFNLTAFTEGEPEEGYQEGVASISPTYVYISGPVSLVGQISRAGIVIDTDGANADLSGSAVVKCFDANDNEIPLDERVTISRSEIDYTLPILKVKNLSLNFETEGRVAEGYRYTGIESSVNSVSVVGLKSDLAGVNSITIPRSELNMDGASGDKTVVIDLTKYLPEGVELANPGQSELEVTIKVEPLETRTIDLPVSEIRQVGALGSYTYGYNQDSIQVTIEGLKEDLDLLNPEDLGAEMDVSAMEPGIYEGEVTFQLGAAYALVGYTKPQITVQEKGPSAASGTAAASEDETEETAAGTEEDSTADTEIQD